VPTQVKHIKTFGEPVLGARPLMWQPRKGTRLGRRSRPRFLVAFFRMSPPYRKT
jgi:hypothetical protein